MTTWNEFFDQVVRQTQNEEVEGVLAIGLRAESPPEAFMLGELSPNDFIEALRSMEGLVRRCCCIGRDGALRWDDSNPNFGDAEPDDDRLIAVREENEAIFFHAPSDEGRVSKPRVDRGKAES